MVDLALLWLTRKLQLQECKQPVSETSGVTAYLPGQWERPWWGLSLPRDYLCLKALTLLWGKKWAGGNCNSADCVISQLSLYSNINRLYC